VISRKHLSTGLAPLAQQAARQIPLVVVLLLLLAAFASLMGSVFGGLPAWMERSLDTLSNVSTIFLGIFIEAAPFLLLGTLASGLVEVFVARGDLARWMPRQPLTAALSGAVIGLFFPVCECGVVPFARRLINKGAPVPAGIAALLAAPVMNPIVIASTLAAYGPGWMLWSRLGLTLLIAVIVGLAFSLHPRPEELLRITPAAEAGHACRPGDHLHEAAPSLMTRLRRALAIAVDEFFEMGRFLVLGALMAALMQTYVRQSALMAVGQGDVLPVLVLMALAVLLSVCSTVDAFIALAFTGTFTGGAVLAFLVFGPMVDIKSGLMFLRVFKPRAAALLVLLPFALTLLAALLINAIAPGGLY
jgi:uncharacterized membrane protein YraQ (UPF0718 family)